MKLLSTLLLLLTLASCGSGGGGSKPVVVEPEQIDTIFAKWHNEFTGTIDYTNLEFDTETEFKSTNDNYCHEEIILNGELTHGTFIKFFPSFGCKFQGGTYVEGFYLVNDGKLIFTYTSRINAEYINGEAQIPPNGSWEAIDINNSIEEFILVK